MTVKAVVVFRLQSRDLRPTNILEAVDHIRRQEPSAISGNFRMEVHQIASKVGRHIVPNAIVERIQTEAILAVLALPLQTDVEIDGLLRLQIGIADPIVAETCTLKPHRRTRIHLPIIVQLAHTRLRITRAEIRLKATVRFAADVVRQPEVKRRVRAEKIAVVNAQDWR